MAKNPQNRNQNAKKEAEAKVAERTLNVLDTSAPSKGPEDLRAPELTPAEQAAAALAPKAPVVEVTEQLTKGTEPLAHTESKVELPTEAFEQKLNTFVQPAITNNGAQGENKTLITKRDAMTQRAAAIASRIDQYVTAMSRGSGIDAKEGIKQQVRLYYIFLDIVKSDAVDFKELMDYLLDTIYANRDNAFSFVYVRRWTTSITELSEREIYNFDYLLNLFVTVGSSANRARALRQVSLADALRYMPDARASQLVSGYFAAYTS